MNAVKYDISFNSITSEENVKIANGLLQKIATMYNFAKRTKKVSIGFNNTLYLNPRKIGTIIIDKDLGESSKQKLESYCKSETPFYTLSNSSSFSEVIFFNSAGKQSKTKDDIDDDNSNKDKEVEKKIKVITIHKSEFSKKINEYLMDLHKLSKS